MGMCRKVPVTKAALFVTVTLLLWRLFGDRDRTAEEELLTRLEEEKKTCLWRKGLEGGGVFGDDHTFSTFHCPVGEEAYPRNLCTAHFIFLNHSEKRFVARTPTDLTSRTNLELSPFHWPIRATSKPLPLCTQYFDEVFAFTVDMSTSPDDRYYRLHTSTFIPMYSLLTLRRHFGPIVVPGYRVALMTATEDYSIKAVDWKSKAFTGHHKYELSYQLLQAFAGGMETIPLVDSSLRKDEITCIRVAHFGVSSATHHTWEGSSFIWNVGVVNISDPSLLRGFSVFIRARLGLPRSIPTPSEPVVCLVRRSGNRRILNEEEVVSALSKFVRVEVVQLDALSYHEQVAQMQKFTILVGFHGAELLNALYMPPDSVTVQLIPLGAKSLPVSSYAQLLGANGPYLEWQNRNERMSRPNEVGDRDNNHADTILNTDDITDLVQSAMKLGINAKLVNFN